MTGSATRNERSQRPKPTPTTNPPPSLVRTRGAEARGGRSLKPSASATPPQAQPTQPLHHPAPPRERPSTTRVHAHGEDELEPNYEDNDRIRDVDDTSAHRRAAELQLLVDVTLDSPSALYPNTRSVRAPPTALLTDMSRSDILPPRPRSCSSCPPQQVSSGHSSPGVRWSPTACATPSATRSRLSRPFSSPCQKARARQPHLASVS